MRIGAAEKKIRRRYASADCFPMQVNVMKVLQTICELGVDFDPPTTPLKRLCDTANFKELLLSELPAARALR
jgi:hypothetical protein